MSWAVGFDPKWDRDIGYGVPAICDHPDCAKEIDRGLSYVCGGDVRGGDHGCGLYFCEAHHPYYGDEEGTDALCERCIQDEPPFEPKPDTPEWLMWKLTDESWARWREENPERVDAARAALPEQDRDALDAVRGGQS